jgi:hypothetical protein
MPWEVIAIGVEHVARKYEQVMARVLDHEPVYEGEVSKLLEEDHKRFFDMLGGRYVLSGETRASLTERGAGSIRRMHMQGFDFGTQVEQAGYLTKSPHDPEYSQVPKPNRGDLRSAVLVFPEATQVKVAKVVTVFIAEAFAGL